MVRRGRSSSPRASAPVRSATRAPPPSGTPMRSEARPKQSAASPTAGAQPPQQGSGLLGQMAATAGGVAIGSAMVSLSNSFLLFLLLLRVMPLVTCFRGVENSRKLPLLFRSNKQLDLRNNSRNNTLNHVNLNGVSSWNGEDLFIFNHSYFYLVLKTKLI